VIAVKRLRRGGLRRGSRNLRRLEGESFVSSDLIRWGGLAAMLGGVLGIVLTPPIALAYTLAFGGYADLPSLTPLTEVLFPLDFASGELVYYTYGRLYFLTLLPELLALCALRGLRRGRARVLERWGFRLSLIGMWLAVLGVFTDYWVSVPPGFWTAIVATPFLAAGFVLLGVGWWRMGAVPLWITLTMVGAAVGTFPIMFFVVEHWPSGPLLLFHVTWVALGYLLWSGRSVLAE
jgi:hypothetical protein